jgi:hypothetical protein
MTLWRVLVMKHKKDEFIMGCKRDLRTYSKEYDEKEISNLENSEESINNTNKNLAEAKVYNFNLEILYKIL